MSTLTSQLVLSLVDKVTGPARAAAGSVGRLREAANRNAKQMQAMRGQMVDAAAMGYLLAKAVSAPIAAAMKFEEGMGNVATLLDTNVENMSAMGKEVLDIAKTTPVALSDLTSGLYDVRSAGILSANAIGVLKKSSRLAVAGLGSTKEAVDLVTSSVNAFKLEGEDQHKIYDTIFKSVKNGKTTISQLAQGFGGVAGTVASAGVAIDEYFASVAALTSTGLPAAQAHTQIRAAIAGLTRETKQSKAVFKALGVKTFPELIRKAGGMVPAFKLIRDQLGGNDAALIKLLGSVEAYNSVLGLTETVNETYVSTLDDMRNGAKAVDIAFEKQARTSKALMQSFRNQMEVLGVAIGNALLPALNSILKTIEPIIVAISDFAAANPELTSTIVSLVAGLVALKVASIAARFAFLFLKGGVLDASIGVARGVGFLTKAVTGLGSFIGMARRVGLAMTLLSATGGTGLFAGLIKGLSAASAAIAPIVGTIVAAIASITWPIWAVIGVAAVLGLAIYNYWEPIKNFVVGFYEVVSEALGSVVAAIIGFGAEIATAVGNWAKEKLINFAEWLGFDPDEVRALIDGAVKLVSDFGASIRSTISDVVENIGNWISDIFTMNDYSDEAEANFRETGRQAGKALVDAIKNGFTALIDWFASLPSQLMDAFGSINIGDLIDWPEPPDWLKSMLGGGDENAPGAKASEALAMAQQVGELQNKINRYSGATDTSSYESTLAQLHSDMETLSADLPSAVQSDLKAYTATIVKEGSAAGAKARELGQKIVVALSVQAKLGIDTSAIDRAATKVGALSNQTRNLSGGAQIRSAGGPAIAGARAAGGPVVGGKTYLVGEEGAELFSPSRSGYIHPAGDTGRALSQGASGNGVSVTFGDIVIHGAQDADTIARQIGQKLNDALSGIQADTEWAIS